MIIVSANHYYYSPSSWAILIGTTSSILFSDFSAQPSLSTVLRQASDCLLVSFWQSSTSFSAKLHCEPCRPKAVTLELLPVNLSIC